MVADVFINEVVEIMDAVVGEVAVITDGTLSILLFVLIKGVMVLVLV